MHVSRQRKRVSRIGRTSTLTRARVLRAIVQSDQITKSLEAMNAFVASQYYGYLRNDPSNFRTMVNEVLNSQKCRLKVWAAGKQRLMLPGERPLSVLN